MVVFGGFGGDDTVGGCATGKNGQTTCNNCTANFTVCNKTRAYDSLKLRFTFQSNDSFGVPTLNYSNGTGTTQLSTNATINPTTAPGQTVDLSVSWSAICAAIDPTATDCSAVSGSSLSVNLGISETNDGEFIDEKDDAISFQIKVVSPVMTVDATPAFDEQVTAATTGCLGGGGLCDFTLTKGDEKATIEGLSLESTGLSTTYKQLYFYCSQVDFNDITSEDECTPPVTITGNNALTDTVITGLTNGVKYYFRAGIADEAGNIGLYFLRDVDCTDSVTTNCHSVTPEEVVGLFNDTNCFIATAAFGSPMEKQVKALRRFRDDVLQKTSLGRAFIAAYYTVSPPAARWIAQKSFRRTVARVTLTPVVFLITAVMEYPIAFSVLMLSFIIGFAIWLRRPQGVRA